MRCLDRFNKKMNRSGGSLRGEQIFNSKMLLKETFHDNSADALGIFFWELGKLKQEDYEDDIPISIRLYKRTFSAANGYTVKFQTEIDTPIIVGDIVYDSINDEYYICTESHNINTIHYQGKFTLCNWILKWQKDDGTILEYPCYDINATQYNSGETGNRQFVIGTAQHMITLPYDENTVVLNTPKRFFIDRNTSNPTAYIVTQNDTTSHFIGKKGLIKLTLAQTVRDDKKDRIDLGICDYREITDDMPDGGVQQSIIEYDTNVIKSGGDSQKFIGKFYDSNGNELTDVVPKWTIICDFENELEVEESGNEIYIGIDNEKYLDEEIKLAFSDEYGNYSSTLLITIDSLL